MKLKKLILSGFKSFADRTEFEFDDGISCIVGPNGCGKSNVVDAIKWVLGEQSAKSLRGGEMMDVIFNGAAGRKPSGMAEVSLIFDNPDGLLKPNLPDANISTEQVGVTRRLYRSGQSEYLINKVPSRLRDIREMFMDTGIGTDAYSIIEQGRVEGFLQANQDDRRAFFDEAAGISRYKARKKEAVRKLERVNQDMARLNDILGEVEKNLRSIKIQAGKARNYVTCSQQLKELRSLHFLAQYHELCERRKVLQGELDNANDLLASITSRIGQLESAQAAARTEADDLDRTAGKLDSDIAATAGQLDAAAQRQQMQRSRLEETGNRILLAVQRCEQLEAKADTCFNDIRVRTAELEQIGEAANGLQASCDALAAEQAAAETDLGGLAARLEDEKSGAMDLFRKTAALHNEIQSHAHNHDTLCGHRKRLQGQAEEIAKALESALADKAQAQARLDDIREVAAESQNRFQQAQQQAKNLTQKESALQKQLLDAREARSAAIAKRETLRQMQDRLEGVSGGARRILEARRQGRLGQIVGLLGDMIDCDTAHAAIVESALAGADQFLLASRLSDVQACQSELAETVGNAGNVEILCLDRLEPFKDDGLSADSPHVMGRLIDHVRFAPDLAPVIWRLLGKTLVVAGLQHAADAAGNLPHGYRFVTSDGVILEADGRIRFGSSGKSAGVITRRSEMSELNASLESLEKLIEQIGSDHASVKAEVEHNQHLIHQFRTSIYEARTEEGECTSRISHLSSRIAELERQEPLVAAEVEALAGQIETVVKARHQADEKARELDRLAKVRDEEIAGLNGRIAGEKSRLEEIKAKTVQTKVELAKSQERLAAARSAIAALQQQRQEMLNDVQAGRQEIQSGRQTMAEIESAIAADQENVRQLQARLDDLRRESAEIKESRQGLAKRIEDICAQIAEQRASQEQAAARTTKTKIDIGASDANIQNIIARADDEMQMDLLELHRNYAHDQARDWQAVEAEISQLRERIERLGNVNLDAITEQEQLEKRHEFLTGQMADINKSQTDLDELIKKLNEESNQLFQATFESVRENFRELFRKLFGGGSADVVLANPEDLLESPIDIMAKPPGKELKSITLLSGGEKTMTALALLFSFFRSRPSPFCLLDEVDAALDEANNQRYNMLVQEFVRTSQFIMISHSKRTMSAARVLYGVTMQEPGVSKRISVRFEEVDEHLDAELQPA
ncbi:MAG: chromosome segregation protein SMC [Planctomycetes bacterium]|nr:chromosome segregation protein SMC [Planctomycetota bacterium]